MLAKLELSSELILVLGWNTQGTHLKSQHESMKLGTQIRLSADQKLGINQHFNVIFILGSLIGGAL